MISAGDASLSARRERTDHVGFARILCAVEDVVDDAALRCWDETSCDMRRGATALQREQTKLGTDIVVLAFVIEENM